MARLDDLKATWDAFEATIPPDMVLQMEAMYQAFKARIMYETHVQGKWVPEGQIVGQLTDRILPRSHS